MQPNRLKNLVQQYDQEKLSDRQIKMAIESSDLSPLDFLVAVLRDNSLAVSTRLDAAKSAAPFMHQKKPLAVEGTDKPLIPAEALRGMAKSDLAQLEQILSRAGVAVETQH